MKKLSWLVALFALLISSCKNGDDTVRQKQFPKAGTVVAKDQMPVTVDTLNHFTYTVQVTADSDIVDGVYDVKADYEYHTSEGNFTMPKNCEDAKVVMKKGSDPYTYIIGFRLRGDSTFHDYFQVQATSTHIEMKYIKAYTFQ